MQEKHHVEQAWSRVYNLHHSLLLTRRSNHLRNRSWSADRQARNLNVLEMMGEEASGRQHHAAVPPLKGDNNSCLGILWGRDC